ncbi:MAG: lipid II:glycine glycyltransferase FemX [Desulfatirhabdiaceae bacterium]
MDNSESNSLQSSSSSKMGFERIQLENAEDMESWDEYVIRHPKSTPYHLSPWLKTIAATYGFRDFLYAQRDADGNFNFVLPLFRVTRLFSAAKLVSLPFSDYGGPLSLFESDQPQLLQKFLHDQIRKTCSVELRGSAADCSSFNPFFYFKRHILDLDRDIAKIENSINKKTIKYSIRKAEKAGICVDMETDREAMHVFSRLNHLTRKKRGVPAQPPVFFDNLYKYVIAPGHGFIMIARHEGKPIAASLFLAAGDHLHYKYNASDPEALKTLTPNHLLLWNTIKLAKERGYRTLDFGRSSPDNMGLIRYKEMWGVECFDAPYFFYGCKTGASSVRENSAGYSVVTRVWARLPDSVTNFLEPLIFPYLA